MLRRQMRHAGDAPAHPRWQRGVLLIDECRVKVVRREGSAPSRAGCRPAMLLLHHRRLFKIGRWSWNCANLSGSSDPRTSLYAIQRKNLRAGGVAPPLFTQWAWFYRPGRHIWQSPRAPVEVGQGRGTCTHPAGFTGPSANWLHYPLKNGRAGGTCTRDPLLPGQVRWLLRYSPKFVPGHRLHPIPRGR
jgi:hypothetical protein